MPPFLSINSPQKIQAILEDVRDQRSKNFISLARDKNRRHDLSGVLREISESSIMLEIAGMHVIPESWLGEHVRCYFRIRNRSKKVDIFYNHTSQIQEISGARGSFHLHLTKPMTLQLGQRRSSIRVDPASDDILGFSLWEEDSMVFHCPRQDRIKLREPLIGEDHFGQGLVLIQNISAGGMRIRLLSNLHQQLTPSWNRGARLVIWLVLADHGKHDPRIHWLKGRVSYKIVALSSDMDFGVEFTAVGKSDQKGKFIWAPVMDNDIPEIGSWTYQLYLSRFRRGIV